mmetsp:Transcript_12335/g.27334  ORF Transcript_12335/g.27334 Transcript_12335/m.27334 type:complete len:250 (-) Transcript_12335:794-1543(-)
MPAAEDSVSITPGTTCAAGHDTCRGACVMVFTIGSSGKSAPRSISKSWDLAEPVPVDPDFIPSDMLDSSMLEGSLMYGEASASSLGAAKLNKSSSAPGLCSGSGLKQDSMICRVFCGSSSYSPRFTCGCHLPRFGNIFADSCWRLLHSGFGMLAASNTSSNTKPNAKMSAATPALRGTCQPSGGKYRANANPKAPSRSCSCRASTSRSAFTRPRSINVTSPSLLTKTLRGARLPCSWPDLCNAAIVRHR